MLTVAYIGFGNSVCRYHLPYVKKREEFINVKYVYRREEDRVGDTERETWYPEIIFTSDIDVVMKDPEVNLVVVNTPNEFHVDYSMMALEHGKNVLCEKPFAMTADEARKVFDYAKEKGLIAMANQNRRYDSDMRTVRKVIESGVLGGLVELESHYDYYRPQIADSPRMAYLYGLAVHPLDQIIGEFGKPNKVVYDCRSVSNLGEADDYYDFDLFYDNPFKAIVKTSYYVKIDYPRFTVHGKKGSFIMPTLGHNSNAKQKPGPIEVSFDLLPEETWGTLSYIDENGKDVTMKVPTEATDYGIIYDNINDMLENNAEKLVKDEEVIAVLEIIEKGTQLAKEAK
ncbi:Gfo/Idh/MocA family oxidoreductase [Breznakia pachnodae]|uniref:Dehydrogenase n=1 Tax=Breznakia pachnodae TaxID=265178 RepID=A0ABU0E838_9FIRM|nr:Gfo/Idh/MocA family oxidoreductase [Breznakia pachnodae]MDQ0363052.1 putative dehydrogenase [Breznakia pachnodae]